MNVKLQMPHNDEAQVDGVSKLLADASSSVGSPRFDLVLDGKIEFFPLPWIPIQTAIAIHPTAARPALVTLECGTVAWVVGLTKLCGNEGEQSTLALTDSDWAELYDVWSDLPPISLPVPESQFEPYQAAVLRSLNRLTFDLYPMFDAVDSAMEALIREATSHHRTLLMEQIKKRVVVPRNPNTMVAMPGEWHPNLVLTLEDLRTFAGQLLISVRVNASGAKADQLPATPKTAANPNGVPWRREGLGVLERREQLLAKFQQLGGSVDKDYKLQSKKGALAALVRLDGRQKDTLREQLQKAARAQAATPRADVAAAAPAWFSQLSSPATRKR